MVSKTLQSLDTWLALAEEVLAEQSGQSNAEAEPDKQLRTEPLQLRFDLDDA